MTPFRLLTAHSPEDAVALLASNQGAALLAGGTSLLDLMKLGVTNPRVVIDISRVGGLDSIERAAGGWRIGALARNADVANHPDIVARLPMLAQAIRLGASGQLRNMATMGGNLLQRTRCSYFRDTHSACNKRAPGSGCDAINGVNRGHAILGTSDRCIATHPGDMAVALAALAATVHLRGPEHERVVPFTDFNLEPASTPERETAMLPGEVIVGVEVPALSFGNRSMYRKVRDRASYEFALVSCAVALDIADDGSIRESRIALGGVATKPWRAWDAEAALRGGRPNLAAFRQAAEAAMAAAIARKHNGFKIRLARRVLVQTLADVAEMPA
ncbi:FAD binding domain-containing protein [Rhodopila sp.]|uniref:FAD binding domain-containing protein n=1 Tax=Rhodopila sp. TaxID=2480087 RepID=UPI003D134771